MLDEDPILENPDLGSAVAAAHYHDPLDAFAAGKELLLGNDRAATTGLTALASAQLLRFEARRTAHGGRFIARATGFADPRHGPGRVVAVASPASAGPPTTTPTFRRRLVLVRRRLVLWPRAALLVRLLVVIELRAIGAPTRTAPTATAATSTPWGAVPGSRSAAFGARPSSARRPHHAAGLHPGRPFCGLCLEDHS